MTSTCSLFWLDDFMRRPWFLHELALLLESSMTPPG
jgi:hypothetical protein